MALSLTLAACSDDVVERLSGDAGAASSGTTASTTSGPVGSTGSSASTTAPADDTRGTTGADTTGVLFFAEPDLGDQAFACSIFTQDCPAGQKCMPWANDSGSAWNAWGCKPVADDPAGPGEPCTVEGSGASGLDDCQLGAMCWDVDRDTNEGTCVAMCTGAEDTPTCDDPFHSCLLGGEGALLLCLPTCDPLQQDCPEGQACYTGGGLYWQCGPDASGNMGVYGDPCDLTNSCDPGLVCLFGADAVPPGEACDGAGGCCTEVCDLFDPLGDLQCAGAAGGQQCVPWYDPGEALPVHEHVGVCTVP